MSAPMAVIQAWGREPRRLAEDNKVLDLWLEGEAAAGRPGPDLPLLRQRRAAIRQAVGRVATALTGVPVEWAVFKTIRPFDFTPSDVDLVVFGDNQAHQLATRLSEHGYRREPGAPHTLTVCDLVTDVGIDLYQDIAASRFVYIDRAILRPYCRPTDIDGIVVPMLGSIGELLAILAHAVFKEQLFTLADYLTVRHYGASFTPAEWEELLRVATAHGLRRAVLWCLQIVKGMAGVVGDARPWPAAIDAQIGAPIVPRRPPQRLLDPRRLTAAVAERALVSGAARRSLLQLVAQVVNPVSPHTRSFYRQLWLRARGVTY